MIPPRLYFLKDVRIVFLLLILLVCLVLMSGLVTPDAVKNRQTPLVGMRMPNLALDRLAINGEGGDNTLFLTNQWAGQPAVIHVFASWCKECVSDQRYMAHLANSGIKPYGIAWKDSEGAALSYLTRSGNPYQSVGVDEQGSATPLLSIDEAPTTYLVDKQGYVRWKYDGSLNDTIFTNQLVPTLQRLYAE